MTDETSPIDRTTVAGLPQANLRVNRDERSAFSVAGGAILVRWRLDGEPHPQAVVVTDHAGIHDLAVHPHRPLLAVAPQGEPVELRHHDGLCRTDLLTELVDATALAFSPDGQRVAVATSDERVVLFDLNDQAITADVEGGERTTALAFSPDGRRLASACSFQGGGHVQLDHVTMDGRLEPRGSVERADHDTPADRFIDTIPAVAFAADSRSLVLWETSSIYHSQRPAGWRGALVMADASTGSVLWERSLDVATTGVRTSLAVAGAAMGYFTDPCFAMGGEAVAVGIDGAVVFLASRDGAPLGLLRLTGTANAVRRGPTPHTLLISTDQGLRQEHVPSTPGLPTPA